MTFSEATAFALVSRCMDRVLRGQLAPWAVEHRIMRITAKAGAQARESMAPLLMMWGRFAQPGECEDMVRRAAHGWLALRQNDAAARAAYLDHWIYEELGYRRKPPGKTAAAAHQQRPKLKSPLTARLPKHSGDTEGARELVALGYPVLAPVLPQLFRWLETGDSPVALVLRPFFAELGAPARELACDALRQDKNPALKHCLLRYVLPSWPRDIVATLPLERYLYDADAYGLDIWALKLMMAMRIPTHEGLRGLAETQEWKIARLKEHLGVLTSLEPLASSPAGPG